MTLQTALKGSRFEKQTKAIEEAFAKRNVKEKDYLNIVSIFGFHVGGVDARKLQSHLIKTYGLKVDQGDTKEVKEAK
jgi:hypothetical protein